MDNQKFCRFRNLESHLRNSIKMLRMVFIFANSISPSWSAQVEKVNLDLRRHTCNWKIVKLKIFILGWLDFFKVGDRISRKTIFDVVRQIKI